MEKKKKTKLYVFLTVVFVGIFMTGICLGIHRGIGQNNVFDDSEKREQRVQEWVENDIEVALSMADWTGKEEEREQCREKLMKWYLEESE